MKKSKFTQSQIMDAVNGFGLTTMTEPIWLWADSTLSSDRPWLLNVSSSETHANREGYQRSHFSFHISTQ